jgi:hypothetical protein
MTTFLWVLFQRLNGYFFLVGHLCLLEIDDKIIAWVVGEDDPLESINFREMPFTAHAVNDLEGLLAVNFDIAIGKIFSFNSAIRTSIFLYSSFKNVFQHLSPSLLFKILPKQMGNSKENRTDRQGETEGHETDLNNFPGSCCSIDDWPDRIKQIDSDHIPPP